LPELQDQRTEESVNESEPGQIGRSIIKAFFPGRKVLNMLTLKVPAGCHPDLPVLLQKSLVAAGLFYLKNSVVFPVVQQPLKMFKE
tara:strand:- start:69197 stop:69454 length:258 start_codon:yes stop_codon:yes gene_type:complete